MRVFAKKALRLFWETPGQEDAEGPLEWWFKNVSKWNVSWKKFAEVKAMFGSASIFKDCVIFNIGGNKYRLIVTIAYPHSVFVVQVLTHHEYDKGTLEGCL